MFREPVIIELSNYVKPKIEERINEDWVLNGRYNGFFQYIIDRYNGSPTNAALINAYVDRIYGKGISIVNAKNNASEYARLLSILPKKELRKIVSDFKLFGSAVGQIVYAKSSKRRIVSIKHMDRISVAPSKADKGEVKKYFVCDNWKNTLSNVPKSYPAFGYSNSAPIEIFEIKPYKAGKVYFADPDYLPGLQYAMLEEEISNFSVNHIMNGLSAGVVINFNNGEPSPEIKDEMDRSIKRKLSGSNGAKIIVSFNDSADTAPTIEAVPNNSNHEQWIFWAGEARQQLLVAHRVTSPILFGVKDNTGLGNNANEMEEGNKFLSKYTIRPLQTEILEALEEIVSVNNISSPLEFLPIEEAKDETEEEKPDPTKPPLKLEAHDNTEALIECGEDEDDEDWICICEEEVDYDLEDTRDEVLQLQVSTGTAIPNAKSVQDSDKFKIRYAYAPSSVSDNSRPFCQKMVSANKVYRKEDIIRMEGMAVNPGWGPEGVDNYSIWLYKGGGGCHHKWLRKTYVKKGIDVDVNSPLAEMISTAEARRRGDKTRNEREVSMKPIDMPYEGFLPTNKQRGFVNKLMNLSGFDPNQKRAKDGKWTDVGSEGYITYLEDKKLYRGDTRDKGDTLDNRPENQDYRDFRGELKNEAGFYFFTDELKEAEIYAMEAGNESIRENFGNPIITEVNVDKSKMFDLSGVGLFENSKEVYTRLNKTLYDGNMKLNDFVQIMGVNPNNIPKVDSDMYRGMFDTLESGGKPDFINIGTTGLSNGKTGVYFKQVLKNKGFEGYIFNDVGSNVRSNHYAFISNEKLKIANRKPLTSKKK